MHLEIIRERLERECDLDLISTSPNVDYQAAMADGAEIAVTNPERFARRKIDEIREPKLRTTILTPTEFIGAIMELCQGKRGTLLAWNTSRPNGSSSLIAAVGRVVLDFFDQLKSRTRGYASLDYEPDGDEATDLVRSTSC